MRTPVFELHVLPMFRAIDRDHMLFAFDLWDYQSVVENINTILARVGAAADMPPASHGGPWPEEWIALLTRWRETGFKQLELGTATYTWTAGSTNARLTAAGTFPAAGYQGWLHLEGLTVAERQYVFYSEAPDTPQPGNPPVFSVRESYPASDTRSVIVRDATGTHQVH